ncbi:MAG TPA: transcription antitermination factor NusB, partial [Haloplasmataceae bacterium]
MNTVRKLALDVINEVLNNGAYSNLLLSETIKDNSLNNKDKRLLTELVYGTIQYKMTLDYYINQFIGEKKIKNRVRNILRMAFYQKIYLDKIPDFAIINEAVELTKISDMESSSLVNAVLR